MEIFETKIKIPVYLDYKHNPAEFIYGINGISRKDITYLLNKDEFKEYYAPGGNSEAEKCGIFFNRMLNTSSETDFFRDPESGEPFYYPINMTSIIERHIILMSGYINIPTYVLSNIITKRCKILIYSTWEAPTRNDIMHFIKCIIDRHPGIQKKDFVVLTNNLELLYHDEINSTYDKTKHTAYRINKIDGVTCIVHHVFTTVGIDTWQEISYNSKGFEKQLAQSMRLIKKNVNRKHKFVCLNRRPRPARWLAVLYLYPDSVDGLLSFTLDPGHHDINSFMSFDKSSLDNYKLEVADLITSKEPNDINNSINEFHAWIEHYMSMMVPKNDIRRTLLDEIFIKTIDNFSNSDFLSNLPLLIDDNIDPRSNPVSDMSFDKFLNSYLHIVLETETGAGWEGILRADEKYWFSEKIFKPIWCMQPFVMLGFPGALSHLKDLGFKTFDKYIDESYDTEPQVHRRMILALHSAKQFYNRSHKEILADYNDMVDILHHNRNLLLNYATQLNENIKQDLMDSLSECIWLLD